MSIKLAFAVIALATVATPAAAARSTFSGVLDPSRSFVQFAFNDIVPDGRRYTFTLTLDRAPAFVSAQFTYDVFSVVYDGMGGEFGDVFNEIEGPFVAEPGARGLTASFTSFTNRDDVFVNGDGFLDGSSERAFYTGGFVDYSIEDGLGPIAFTAVIFDSVPEPASWVMMIAGFGLTGRALRARRGRAIA